MSQTIRILYIGPAQSETFDTSSLEQQSRAIRVAGGTLVRYEGGNIADLIKALRDVDAAVHTGGFPPIALLGNSFLSRLSMIRSGGAVVLQRNY